MSFTVSTAIGRRSYQEDRSFTYKSDLGTLLAVFDGHSGDETAEWLNVNLPSILIEELATGDPAAALERACKRADAATHDNHAGSTATIVFITSDKTTAHIAVLGDSPVIARLNPGHPTSSDPADFLHVSPEHNVRTNLKEREAAEERGGIYAGGYICRGFSGPGLQMGRAFGDSHLGRIICKEPEIYSITVGDWLLVCSDGVTDPGHGDMDAAIKRIVTMIDSGADAAAIVKAAVSIPTGDNATAILWRRS